MKGGRDAFIGVAQMRFPDEAKVSKAGRELAEGLRFINYKLHLGSPLWVHARGPPPPHSRGERGKELVGGHEKKGKRRRSRTWPPDGGAASLQAVSSQELWPAARPRSTAGRGKNRQEVYKGVDQHGIS